MTEQTNDAATPAAEKRAQAQFNLQRIYVKDISFEAPGSPQCFTVDWQPEVKVQFNSTASRVGDRQYEVVLMINVVAMNGDKVAYVAEVKQAGIFLIDAPEAMVEPLLGAQCPNILFPYARELISDLANRGTFPPFLLQPMNFEAIYLGAKKRQAQEQAAETAKH